MTERKPPPPPSPAPLPPRLDTVRPGLERPEERPPTVGRGANRLPPRPPYAAPNEPPYDPNRPPVGRTSRSTPEPARGGLWLATSAGLLVLVAMAGLAVAYLTLAPPVDLIRSAIIAEVKAKTGRDLVIAGPVQLKIVPELKLSLADVTLSAPPGMTGGPFVTMAGVDASVRLWPLLRREISIDSLVLHQPVFDLRVDASGKRSWDFATLEIGPADTDPAAQPVRYAEAKPESPSGLPDAVKDFIDNASDPANPSPQQKARLARLEGLTLGDVRIDGGSVLYSDARGGSQQAVSNLDASVALTSLASPLDASGSLVYEAQKITFEGRLASPKALLEDRPAKLELILASAPVAAKFAGSVTARNALDVDGDVSASAPSLRALALWLGHALPPAEGFGPFSLAGQLRTSGPHATLAGATLSLDAIRATGQLQLDTDGARPRVVANLKLSELDLNRYTLAAATPTAAAPSAGKPSAPIRPAGAPSTGAGAHPLSNAAKTIEDLINGGAGPKVKGYTRRAGWSDEPFALGALAAADVDARLAIGKVVYRDIKLGQSSATVTVKSKALRATFDDVALYNGRGRGFLTLDINPPVPAASANLTLDGVAAQALLKDAADFDLIAGDARLTLALSASGASEAAMIAATNGKADFAFANGALVGFNIPGAVRGLTKGKLSGFDKQPTEKTDFSELSASFQIANGIATNQDLRLNGPLLRVTGSGRVDLPAQKLDYIVKPKLVASLQGQGATDALAGLEVPVRVTGPWSSPQFTPDVGALLKDPSKAIDAVKDVARQLKDNPDVRKAGDALKGLLGKDQQGNIDTGKAKDFLNKFLKPKPQPTPAQ